MEINEEKIMNKNELSDFVVGEVGVVKKRPENKEPSVSNEFVSKEGEIKRDEFENKPFEFDEINAGKIDMFVKNAGILANEISKLDKYQEKSKREKLLENIGEITNLGDLIFNKIEEKYDEAQLRESDLFSDSDEARTKVEYIKLKNEIEEIKDFISSIIFSFKELHLTIEDFIKRTAQSESDKEDYNPISNESGYINTLFAHTFSDLNDKVNLFYSRILRNINKL